MLIEMNLNKLMLINGWQTVGKDEKVLYFRIVQNNTLWLLSNISYLVKAKTLQFI